MNTCFNTPHGLANIAHIFVCLSSKQLKKNEMNANSNEIWHHSKYIHLNINFDSVQPALHLSKIFICINCWIVSVTSSTDFDSCHQAPLAAISAEQHAMNINTQYFLFRIRFAVLSRIHNIDYEVMFYGNIWNYYKYHVIECRYEINHKWKYYVAIAWCSAKTTASTSVTTVKICERVIICNSKSF